MKYIDLLNIKTKYSEVFNKILDEKLDETKNIYITECASNVAKLFASKLFSVKQETIIYVTSSIYEASKAYEVLSDMVGTDFVSFFPVEEFISSQMVATSDAFRLARMLTIYHIVNNIPQIIVTNTEGLTKQLMTKDKLTKSIINLTTNDIINRDALVENLIIRGYKKVAITSNSGTFSVRGSLIDVFPINEDTPIRINFFDDEIEKIKRIDVETQMSIETINEISIFPLYEIYYDKNQIENIKNKILEKNAPTNNVLEVLENIENYQNLEQIYMYLPFVVEEYQPFIRLIDKPICIYEDYQASIEHEKAMMFEISEFMNSRGSRIDNKFFVNLMDVMYDAKLNVYTNLFNTSINGIKIDKHYKINTTNAFEYNNNIRAMLEDIKVNTNKTYLITHLDDKKLNFIE